MKALLTLLFVLCLATTGLGQTAPSKPEFKNPEANAAVTAAASAEARAQADCDKAIAAAKTKLIEALTVAQNKATKAGDLDEAVKLRDRIAAVKAEIIALSPAAPTAPADAKPFISPQELLGVWQETSGAKYVFKQDGTFDYAGGYGKGNWHVTRESLVITFTSHAFNGHVMTFNEREDDHSLAGTANPPTGRRPHIKKVT